MNTATAHLNPATRFTADHQPQALQAVSLDDYEQLVSTRVSFVDFLLASGEAAA